LSRKKSIDRSTFLLKMGAKMDFWY